MCPLTKIVEYIVDNQEPVETNQSVKSGIKTYDLFVGKWRETDEKLKKLLTENLQESVGPEAELKFYEVENFDELETQSFQPIPTDAKYRNLIIRYPDDKNNDDHEKFREQTNILLNWINEARNHFPTQSIMY